MTALTSATVRQPRPQESFDAKHTSPETGCWEWTGEMHWAGYGLFCVNRKRYRAHRVALILEGIEIPAGMLVCHHCDNRKCVRPDHLFIGTQSDNVRDMYAKGRWHLNAPATCPRGHSFTPQNAGLYRGWRYCRACKAERMREQRHPERIAV